jgi:hypothetical protein
MRHKRLELQPVTAQRPAAPRWMPTPAVPPVGLDPAIWSERVRQVAIWQLIETWNAGRRLH